MRLLVMLAMVLVIAVGCGDDSEPLPDAGLGVECADRDVPPDVELVQVFVAAKDVPAGTAPEIFDLEGWAFDSAPEVEWSDDAVKDPTELDQLVPTRLIEACSVLLVEDFAEPTAQQQASIEEQLEAYGPKTPEEVRTWLTEQGLATGIFSPEVVECFVDRLLAEPGVAEAIIDDPFAQTTDDAVAGEALNSCERAE